MDIAFDFSVEQNAPLEVMISNLDTLFLMPDYFEYIIIRYGREIYSMEKEAMKKIVMADLLNLSEEYLESAKEVLNRNRIRLVRDVK